MNRKHIKNKKQSTEITHFSVTICSQCVHWDSKIWFTENLGNLVPAKSLGATQPLLAPKSHAPFPHGATSRFYARLWHWPLPYPCFKHEECKTLKKNQLSFLRAQISKITLHWFLQTLDNFWAKTFTAFAPDCIFNSDCMKITSKENTQCGPLRQKADVFPFQEWSLYLHPG